MKLNWKSTIPAETNTKPLEVQIDDIDLELNNKSVQVTEERITKKKKKKKIKTLKTLVTLLTLKKIFPINHN